MVRVPGRKLEADKRDYEVEEGENTRSRYTLDYHGNVKRLPSSKRGGSRKAIRFPTSQGEQN
jgi:hypothetical protein